MTGDQRRGDRHRGAPISWRPSARTRARLEAQAAQLGMPVHKLITMAVERELAELDKVAPARR